LRRVIVHGILFLYALLSTSVYPSVARRWPIGEKEKGRKGVHDRGKGREKEDDCSSPYAHGSSLLPQVPLSLFFSNDTDSDRKGERKKAKRSADPQGREEGQAAIGRPWSASSLSTFSWQKRGLLLSLFSASLHSGSRLGFVRGGIKMGERRKKRTLGKRREREREGGPSSARPFRSFLFLPFSFRDRSLHRPSACG